MTKRAVGIALTFCGLLIILGTMAVDWFGAGKWTGLGPAQRLAIAAGLGVCLVGISLIPLGDRPA